MFFFSSTRRHTISLCDWSSDVCSSDLVLVDAPGTYKVTMWHEGFRPRGVDKDGRPLYDEPRSEERRVGKERGAGRWRLRREHKANCRKTRIALRRSKRLQIHSRGRRSS